MDVTAVSGNVIITAPVEAMDVSLRSISGRVRTEGVNIREARGRAKRAGHRCDGGPQAHQHQRLTLWFFSILLFERMVFPMAKNHFGGFGGGASMQQLMRQAQKLQEQMAKAQEELDEREYSAQAGGGMVSVTVSGKRELKHLEIKPECVDPEDVEMLQDMILAAVNEALRNAEETRNAEMAKLAPGMEHVLSHGPAVGTHCPHGGAAFAPAGHPGRKKRAAACLSHHRHAAGGCAQVGQRPLPGTARPFATVRYAAITQPASCVISVPTNAAATARICVVRDPRDVAAIERMHDFHGSYHVLHGTLSPMDGIGPDDIRIRELLARLKDHTVKGRSSWPPTRILKGELPLPPSPGCSSHGGIGHASRMAYPWAAIWNMRMKSPSQRRWRAGGKCNSSAALHSAALFAILIRKAEQPMAFLDNLTPAAAVCMALALLCAVLLAVLLAIVLRGRRAASEALSAVEETLRRELQATEGALGQQSDQRREELLRAIGQLGKTCPARLAR